jgi:beta-xylosidase
MKHSVVAAAAAVLLASPLPALDGQPGMHDPSTVVVHDGKFYVYATGGGLPIAISADGWAWRRAGTLMQALPGGRPGPEVIARGGNNTWAPDVIRSGDKYFVYYSAPGTQPKAAIVIGIYNDRQTVIDDGVSKRLTLKKGPNVIRGAIVNVGGATDFCARFLDGEDRPLKGITVSLADR